MAIAAGAGLLGKLFGGAAKGASQERAGQNNATQNQNHVLNQQYGIQQGAATNLAGLQERATMDRAQMGVQAPSARMRQAVLASLIQNTRGAQIAPPAGVNMAKLSGGLTPDSLSAATRAGGSELEKQALLALLTKSDVPGATDYQQSGMVSSPTMGGYKDAGKMESLMSVLGLLGGTAGAIGEIGNINKKPAALGAGNGY